MGHSCTPCHLGCSCAMLGWQCSYQHSCWAGVRWCGGAHPLVLWIQQASLPTCCSVGPSTGVVRGTLYQHGLPGCGMPSTLPCSQALVLLDGVVHLLSSIIRPLCSLRGLWQLPLSGEGVGATIRCSEYGVFPWLGCLPGVCMWPLGHFMHEGLRLPLAIGILQPQRPGVRDGAGRGAWHTADSVVLCS